MKKYVFENSHVSGYIDVEKELELKTEYFNKGEQVFLHKDKDVFYGYVFKDKDGSPLYSHQLTNLVEKNTFDIQENENIKYTFIDNDKIEKTQFEDFEYGEYLTMVYYRKSKKIENELFVRHPNVTLIGNCFGFDARNSRVIIAYVKL